MTTASQTATHQIEPAAFELDSYSIAEFCRRNSICRGTYFNMREAGTGPKEKRAMGRVLITREAAREWRTQ